MRRQAFVNWERVTEGNMPESGKEYMVAEIVEETALMKFAKWYNEGDIVSVRCNASKSISEMSIEERLMSTIFGNFKDYTIPESGFYITTESPELIEALNENGEFDDCIEAVAILESNIFFAEKPLTPEGYISEEQRDKEMEASQKLHQEQFQEEKADKAKEAIEKNNLLKEVVKTLIGTRDISHKEKVNQKCLIGNCRFEYQVSTLEVATMAISAFVITEGLNTMFEAEGGKEKVQEILAETQNSNDLKITVRSMIDKYFNLIEVRDGIRFLLEYIECLNRSSHYFYIRSKYIAKKEYANLANLVTDAYIMSKAMFKISRCCTVRNLNMPNIIMTNELRILTQHMLAHKNIKTLTVDEEEFARALGIHTDGSEYEGLSHIGNFEKEIPYEDERPVNEYDEEEDGNEEETECECECAMAELQDEYFIVDSPNYLCMEGFYALWNPKLKKYYREDGDHVSVYKTWKEVREVAEKVNSEIS